MTMLDMNPKEQAAIAGVQTLRSRLMEAESRKGSAILSTDDIRLVLAWMASKPVQAPDVAGPIDALLVAASLAFGVELERLRRGPHGGEGVANARAVAAYMMRRGALGYVPSYPQIAKALWYVPPHSRKPCSMNHANCILGERRVQGALAGKIDNQPLVDGLHQACATYQRWLTTMCARPELYAWYRRYSEEHPQDGSKE